MKRTADGREIITMQVPVMPKPAGHHIDDQKLAEEWNKGVKIRDLTKTFHCTQMTIHRHINHIRQIAAEKGLIDPDPLSKYNHRRRRKVAVIND